MFGDQYIRYIGWACMLLCLLTFWLLRPRPKRMPESPKRMPESPKPIPYASARGSKPPAPWDDLERRVTELEAELREDSRLTTKCLIQNQCRLDEMDQRVTALENQRPEPAPEPLAPGVRVWKNRDGCLFLLSSDGTDWVLSPDDAGWRETGSPWTATDYEMADHLTELHGHERDEVVRDWMNRGNVSGGAE